MCAEFYEKIPKIPTLRLHKSCIKNENKSILSPNMKSLRQGSHRKKKQPNPSSYDEVIAVQSRRKVCCRAGLARVALELARVRLPALAIQCFCTFPAPPSAGASAGKLTRVRKSGSKTENVIK